MNKRILIILAALAALVGSVSALPGPYPGDTVFVNGIVFLHRPRRHRFWRDGLVWTSGL